MHSCPPSYSAKKLAINHQTNQPNQPSQQQPTASNLACTHDGRAQPVVRRLKLHLCQVDSVGPENTLSMTASTITSNSTSTSTKHSNSNSNSNNHSNNNTAQPISTQLGLVQHKRQHSAIAEALRTQHLQVVRDTLSRRSSELTAI